MEQVTALWRKNLVVRVWARSIGISHPTDNDTDSKGLQLLRQLEAIKSSELTCTMNHLHLVVPLKRR